MSRGSVNSVTPVPQAEVQEPEVWVFCSLPSANISGHIMDPRLRLEILDHCVDVGDINHYFSVTRLLKALSIMVQIANM